MTMGGINLYLLVLLSNLLPGLLAYNDPGALDIAAFNVRIFGKTKMENPVVRNTLKDIILRYDIMLIQEIRDSSGEAIEQLLSLVNQASSVEYGLAISNRLGRTTSKEQYAFLYRKDWVEVVDTYQYNDPNDVFEREPFAIKVSAPRANVQTFGIVAIHTAPSDAEREISELASVYDDVRSRFGTDNIIITGDFNAGCSYVDDWSNIRLANDSRFYWLIDNLKDTTTTKTNCPYDRIVVAGSNLVSSILPLSAGVFYFDETYNLDDDTTQDISDHYPVNMQIETLKESQDVADLRGISVYEKTSHVSKTKARSARTVAEGLGYTANTLYSESGAQALIAMKKSITGTANLIDEFGIILQNFPDVVTPVQIEDVNRYMVYETSSNFLPRGFGKFKTLRDYYSTRERVYDVTISCDMSTDVAKCALKMSSKFL